MSDWTSLVDIALARLSRMSERSAGAILGVSGGTIGRWRKLRADDQLIPEPRGDARNALLRIAAEIEGRTVEESPEQAAASTVHQLVGDEIETLRFLSGIGPVGEGAELKRDYLELVRRIMEARGESPPPDWWYQARRGIDSGKI